MSVKEPLFSFKRCLLFRQHFLRQKTLPLKLLHRLDYDFELACDKNKIKTQKFVRNSEKHISFVIFLLSLFLLPQAFPPGLFTCLVNLFLILTPSEELSLIGEFSPRKIFSFSFELFSISAIIIQMANKTLIAPNKFFMRML